MLTQLNRNGGASPISSRGEADAADSKAKSGPPVAKRPRLAKHVSRVIHASKFLAQIRSNTHQQSNRVSPLTKSSDTEPAQVRDWLTCPFLPKRKLCGALQWDHLKCTSHFWLNRDYMISRSLFSLSLTLCFWVIIDLLNTSFPLILNSLKEWRLQVDIVCGWVWSEIWTLAPKRSHNIWPDGAPTHDIFHSHFLRLTVPIRPTDRCFIPCPTSKNRL